MNEQAGGLYQEKGTDMKPEILIVDDDVTLRKTLSDILQVKGYSPVTVRSGAEAITQTHNHAFVIALIDLKLEDMLGLELLRKLKDISPATECIVLTGYASQTSAIEAINSGAYGYLQKPYEIEQLLLLMHRAREKREADEALRTSEERYRHLFEHAPMGIIHFDTQGVIQECNSKFAEIIGAPREELIGFNMLKSMPPGKARSALRDALDCGTGYFEGSYHTVSADKEIVIRAMHRRIDASDGRILGAIGVFEDIAERKHAEEELRKYREHLEELVERRTAKLRQEITERKKIEDALIRAMTQAEAADRAKSEFLANMSHELRTPLNAILGYAQILKDADNITERQREGLRTIKSSGEHLLHLINDILDLSRIEVGQMELHANAFEIIPFLDHIMNLIQIRAEQKNILFIHDYASDLPAGIYTDEKRLREVLINLLGNAVKFTDRGQVMFRVSRIHTEQESPAHAPPGLIEQSPSEKLPTTELHTRPCVLRFEVEDSGIGIAPECLEEIFIPFRQVSEQRYTIDGTGLGLAISHKLVEMLGGTLHVESTMEQGSTFWFEAEFPALPETAFRSDTVQHPIVGYAGPRKTILVADDKPANRAILVEKLHLLGFNVLEAADGKECIERALRHRPDVMLLDLWMPVLDGLTTAREIRTDEHTQDVIIIAVSASVHTDVRQKSRQAGCDDFLPKPVQFDLLLNLLQTYLHLEWCYQEGEDFSSSTLSEAHPVSAMSPLPTESAQQLRQYAQLGITKELSSILTQIETQDPKFRPVVEALRNFVKQYQFDRMIEFLDDLQS